MISTLANLRRLPRDVQLYAGAWFLIGIGYFGISAVLFNLYLRRLGLGPESIGLLTAAGFLAEGVGAVPAGMIGGQIGNRKAMIWGILIIAVAMSLLVIVEFLPSTMRVGWITLWWVALWLGSSLVIVNGAPWIMDVAAAEQRGNAFTAQLIFESLGGLIGALIAGVLPGLIAKLVGVDADSATAYWLCLCLVPVTYFGAFGCFLLTEPRPPVKAEPTTNAVARFPYPILLFVLVLTFLLVSGDGLIRPFFNLYLDAALMMPLAQIGIVFGVAQVLPIFTALAAPWALTRWGVGRGLIMIGIGNCLCFLVLALIVTWPAAVAAYIAYISLAPIANVIATVFSQEIVEARWRTSVSTASRIGNSLGSALYATLGGFMIAGRGYSSLFFAGALLAILFICLVWGYLRSSGRSKSAEVDTVACV